jgi:hypothetical protein
MKKIKEYITVSATGLDGLNRKINDFIKEDWQPLGGSSMTVADSLTHQNAKEYIYSQALVKYGDDNYTRYELG